MADVYPSGFVYSLQSVVDDFASASEGLRKDCDIIAQSVVTFSLETKNSNDELAEAAANLSRSVQELENAIRDPRGTLAQEALASIQKHASDISSHVSSNLPKGTDSVRTKIGTAIRDLNLHLIAVEKTIDRLSEYSNALSTRASVPETNDGTKWSLKVITAQHPEGIPKAVGETFSIRATPKEGSNSLSDIQMVLYSNEVRWLEVSINLDKTCGEYCPDCEGDIAGNRMLRLKKRLGFYPRSEQRPGHWIFRTEMSHTGSREQVFFYFSRALDYPEDQSQYGELLELKKDESDVYGSGQPTEVFFFRTNPREHRAKWVLSGRMGINWKS
ncbi:hypothetical protein QFC22_002909 [Naganishia vaughanmartiniae]|uniref:Uncharacterized protein n=1 Tax=Naganishia vaughanmartiniae TaxID=1424756 RepID=A0ACC2X9N5_9TREE|nr:hypothetical protein QFC22_002909 [Naganishia vaughanmartiniae]